MLNKNTIIAFVVGVVVGSCLYFMTPKEVVKVEKTQETTQVKQDKEVNKNTVTKIVETVKADGTKVTETLIENKDHIKENTQLNKDKKTESYVAIKNDPNNRISLKALANVSLTPVPYYELNYSRKIWGPIRLEGSIDTRGEKRIGAVVEINF